MRKHVEVFLTRHKKRRDGIAHSNAMDDCQNAALDIAQVAQTATVELIVSFVHFPSAR